MTILDGLQQDGALARARPARGGGALSVTRRGGSVLVLLIGDLDGAEANRLHHRLAGATADGGADVVVDASAAGRLGDGVLDVLQHAAGSARASGGELVVVDAPAALGHRLRSCGIGCRASWIGAPAR